MRATKKNTTKPRKENLYESESFKMENLLKKN